MTYAQNATGSSATGKKPEKNHFYPTPVEPIKALMHHYRHILQDKFFHDGSCGDGRIGKVHEQFGHTVYSTDLIDRGYGTTPVNFLTLDKSQYAIGKFSTIQNPPFKLWGEFVYKCHELEMPFITMFAKSQVWNAAKRFQLWRDHPPKAVHPLTWRIDFDGRGRPTMDCCWCVWGDEVSFSNQPLERVKL